MADDAGNIVETYQYDVYGNGQIRNAQAIEVSRSRFANPYMFTARRYDTETGLYYYRARVYNPYIGRFMQTDPIGYSDGINWYAYCGNNPLAFVDPYGLCKDSFAYSGNAFKDFTRIIGQDLYDYGANIAAAPGDYYGAFRGTGMSPVSSGLQAANFTLGKVVGYSTLMEGLVGVDVRSTRVTEGWERAMQIGTGAVQTAAFVGGLNSTVSKVRAKSLTKQALNKAEDAGNWVLKSSHVEKATRKGARNSGVSIQNILENTNTGKTKVWHEVIDDSGRSVDSHYRPMYKPRAGEI